MNINDLLQLSVEMHASDLHLAPGEFPIVRLHGELVFLTQAHVLTSHHIKEAINTILDKEEQKHLENKLELDSAYHLPQVARFRLNVFHQTNGLAAVFRVIPDKISSLDELDMPAIFKQILNLPHGLILITGPTGSGKSTTLAAMVDYLNVNKANHIITIEDPIEFIHKSKKSLVNQRQVYRDTKSFSSALRAALREDPDVLLVGEMRDLETMRLALTAAETGHLVMATLHTSSAPRTINRIIDVFPGEEKNLVRNILSESLQAVVCQILVRTKNGGRVPAFEIMLGTNAIRNLIREDKISQMYHTIQTGSALGMCTLNQSLAKLAAKQIISPASMTEHGECL